MKRLIVSCLLLVSFFVISAENVNTEYSVETTTFELSKTPISDFVSWFSKETGQTIILGKGVTGDVSFSSHMLMPNEYGAFFNTVLKAHGYILQKENSVYVINVNPEEVVDTEISVVKLYRLKYVRNIKITELVASMLAATVETTVKNQKVASYDVQVLPGTNGIIVTGSVEQLANIDTILEGIDRPQRQVYIEAAITETELGDSNETGVNLLGAFKEAGFVSNTLDSINQSTDNLLMFDSGNFDMFLKAIQANEDTKLLSKPRLMVMDREQGYISVGQNVPFLVSSETTDSGIVQEIERKDVGVSLTIIPHVIGNSVVLQIKQESSSVSNSTVASDIITNKRSLETVVKVKDGQTLSLGGLLSSENRVSESGVPVLKDIPLLGLLFSSKKVEEVQKELKVVIKTRIISDV